VRSHSASEGPRDDHTQRYRSAVPILREARKTGGNQRASCCPLASIVGHVSSTAKRDNGSTVQRPSFKGTATYTADGRFQLIAARTDAPEYKSGNPARPSSDGVLASSGSFTYTGTYTVDENTKTIQANIATSTFPNFAGAADLRRIIKSITADEMSLSNLDTPGLTIDTVWKRAK
jgi:hypothetical protein